MKRSVATGPQANASRLLARTRHRLRDWWHAALGPVLAACVDRSVDAALGRAARRHRRGDAEGAERAYRAILTWFGEHPPTLHLLGVLLAQRGEHAEAAERLERALALAPRLADAWTDLGDVRRVAGRPEDAVRAYRRALELGVDDPRLHRALATVLVAIGEDADAIAALGAVCERDPHAHGERFELARRFAARGRAAEAAAHYRAVVAARPEAIEALNNLGEVCQTLGELDEARQCFERALGVDPTLCGVRNNLAVVLMRQGHLDRALESFATAIDQRLRARLPATPRARPGGTLSGGRGHEALDALESVLAGTGIEAFLCFGTLLGCIRDDAFLAFDKDIDVGVDATLAQRLVAALERDGAPFALVPASGPFDRRYSVSLEHANGTVIDVFLHRREGDTVVAGFYNPTEPVTWRFSAFEIETREFGGRPVRIPADADRYLTEIYGDWRTPDRYFDSCLSGRNLAPDTRRISRCFAYNRLYGALETGDRERGRALCRQVLERFPGDPVAARVDPYLD